MSGPDTIIVLLATCNGEAYLPAQLASLHGQTHARWHLLASDDASTDGSRALLAAAAARDDRITLLPPIFGERATASDGPGSLLPIPTHRASGPLWSKEREPAPSRAKPPPEGQRFFQQGEALAESSELSESSLTQNELVAFKHNSSKGESPLEETRLGSLANFGRLLAFALEHAAGQGQWFALCDQDDVWEPDKLACQLAAARALEQRYGSQTPLLLHSDLSVTDRDLVMQAPSFLKHAGIHHEARRPLATLLAQNFVTGNTILVNRAALALATPLPATAAVHDWWLALVTAATGVVGFIPRPLVRYRQHGANQIGAQSYWRTLQKWRRPRPGQPDASAQFRALVMQARALQTRLQERHAETARVQALVADFLRVFTGERNRWRRLALLRRHRIGRQDALRQALFLLRAAWWHEPFAG